MRNDSDIVRFLKARRPGHIATVPPVVAEIEYGICRIEAGSRKRELLEQQRDRLLSVIPVLACTPRSSALFGEIKAQLERSGGLIDDFDVAIAAIAKAHGAEVVTANLVHFKRVQDLECRSWASE